MRKILFLLVFSTFVGQYTSAQNLTEVYQAGMQAYENKDHEAFLQKMQLADSLRPEHPTIMYNLAAALALNNRTEEAITQLRSALWLRASLDFVGDADFASLKGAPSFKELTKEIEALANEIRVGEKAFELEDKMLHPEGVAYSRKYKSYFIGSVRQRKIIVVDEDGNAEDWMKQGDFMAIMGLQVDEKRGLLWVCSTPAPEMEGIEEGMRAEVLGIDIRKKKVIARYQAPTEGDWLGDLIVSSSGDVYVSNSSASNPTIYQVNEEKGALEVLVEAKELISLQGLTLNQEEDALFFADYRYGLFRVDLESKELQKLESSVMHPLKGIDGLYFHEGALIAIHNGLKPFRIVRYQLDEKEQSIDDYQFVEKALPEMNEPTLGFIKDNDFYYIVNSPWGAYGQEKNLNSELTSKPIIRKVSLK